MSSLRNAVKRRTHKERSQPAARSRYGLLEKKKDYLRRARNFQKQEEALQVLRRKAEFRNPDEYYPAMQRQQQHGANRHTANMTDSEIKALKAQDLSYIALQSQKQKKKLERLQRSLHFVGVATPAQHTVFVDSPDEAASFAPEQHFDTPEELLSRSFNRPRQRQLDEAEQLGSMPATASRTAARLSKRRAAAYQQLLDQQASSGKLEDLAATLVAARAASGKGRKRQVSAGAPGAPPAFKFKRVRQR